MLGQDACTPDPERPLATYAFLTTFEVTAPPEAVFDLVVEPEPWLAAWGDLVTMQRLRDGDGDGSGGALVGAVRAPLGYRVRGRIDVVEATPPTHVVMHVRGTIVGTGTWTLRPTPVGTGVRLDWAVDPATRWLRLLTPVARPAFEAGHAAVVRHGVEAAADRLDAEVRRFRSRSLHDRDATG